MNAISHSGSATPTDTPDPDGAAPLAAAILYSRFPLSPRDMVQAWAYQGDAFQPGLDVTAAHVDAKFYRARYPDLAHDALDAATHYHGPGWREGRNPNDWFDTAFYLQTYPDVADAGMNPLLHYLRHGRAGGRRPCAPAAQPEPRHEDRDLATVAENMDLVYYRGVYRDIDLPDFDPVEHFHRAGWREGRNPSPWFNTSYYLNAYPDVRRAGMNPLLHYARHGRREGRNPLPPGGYRRAVVDAAKPPAERPAGYDAPDLAPVLEVDGLRALLVSACAGARGLVVAVSHDRYVDLTGGVQIFIADEQSLFNGDRFAYLHLAPAIARMTLDRTREPPASVQLVLDGSFIGLATYAAIEVALAELTPAAPPVRVFTVHSLFGHRAAAIAAIAQALRATSCCFWLHDYGSVCEGYNLLRNDSVYCDAPPVGSTACRICVYGDARAAHRAALRGLFEALPFEVLAPSPTALALWQRAAGLPARSMRVHPNCNFQPASAETAAAPPAPALPTDDILRSPVRVAFVGYPLAHKGWPLFQSLLRAALPLGPYQFYHFCIEANRQPMAGLTSIATKVDRDHRFAMVAALAEHRIDLVLVLSPWPETFSYVTYEAFAAGADVVALAGSGNVVNAIIGHDRGVVLRDDAALLRFFTEFAAVQYVTAQRKAGRGSGTIHLCGTTATYDPAATESSAADLDRLFTTDPLLDVIAGNAVLAAERDGDIHRFELPEGTAQVRVVSRSLVPAARDAGAAERRRMGVAIGDLSLDGETLPPGDARFLSGWHASATGGAMHRWTDGNATLATGGARRLEFVLAEQLRHYQRCPLGDHRPADHRSDGERGS